MNIDISWITFTNLTTDLILATSTDGEDRCGPENLYGHSELHYGYPSLGC